MPWGDREVMPGAGQPRDEALRADYKRLIAVRRAHPALWRGVHELVKAEGDVLVYAQRDSAAADIVLVALNRGTAAATASFDVPEGWRGSDARDVWNGETLPLSGRTVEVDLKAKSARILIQPSGG
jgi:alpha-amylase